MILIHSCKRDHNYLENPLISTEGGIPKDSLTFYLPSPNSKTSTYYIDNLDSFILRWYSSVLYSFKEPILNNYYLGYDRYRFLWLRSFHRPIVFSLYKLDDKVSLTYKILDDNPSFLHIQRKTPTIVEKKDLTLTEKEWANFKKLLEKSKFWTDSSYSRDGNSADGSEWIIEAHLKRKYHVVSRGGLTHSLNEVGGYLIKLSMLNEEIY
jgi:hypothetical protein